MGVSPEASWEVSAGVPGSASVASEAGTVLPAEAFKDPAKGMSVTIAGEPEDIIGEVSASAAGISGEVAGGVLVLSAMASGDMTAGRGRP